jgi:hypothetical protein
LETKSHDKETLHTSTATQFGIKTEPENSEDDEITMHLGRSSAASDQGSTNGSATLASVLTEQEAKSLVLKIMQELSDQLEQVEKQLDSTHVVAERTNSNGFATWVHLGRTSCESQSKAILNLILLLPISADSQGCGQKTKTVDNLIAKTSCYVLQFVCSFVLCKGRQSFLKVSFFFTTELS